MRAMPKPLRAGSMRTVLGFDYGRARIGVAVAQELLQQARPLVTLRNRTGRPDWPAIHRLLQEWRPDLLVVGTPRHADGSASDSTRAALGFARELTERSGLAVETIDERLSSHEAEQRLRAGGIDPRRAKDEVDRTAAALIIETWFSEQVRGAT